MRDRASKNRQPSALGTCVVAFTLFTWGLVACQPAGPLRDVVLVANEVSGTVSFIDGHTYENLGSINIIPDIADRMAEINADPTWTAIYGVIK